MPTGLQTITPAKVAISGAAFETVPPISGDSLTFFNVPQGSAAYIAEVWAVNNLYSMEVELTASRFHDQVGGIRSSVPSSASTIPANRSWNINPIGLDQPIFPSDVL